MFQRASLGVVALLLIAISASAQTAMTGAKGYELYSWKIKSHWYYSLVPRSGISKTYEEITAPELVQRDTAGLTSALKKLPRGEEVFWMGDAPTATVLSSTKKALSLKHPSRQRIKRIKAICDKLGIKLSLA